MSELVKTETPRLRTFARVCLLIGALSFGGGLVAWVHREFVVRRKWMADEEFVNGFTIAQILPGANVANLIIYVGQRLFGPLGAILGVSALLIAPFFMVIGAVVCYQVLKSQHWLAAAMTGASSAAIGLLLAMFISNVRRIGRAWRPLVFVTATVIGVGVFRWPLIAVVAVLAPISIGLAWIEERH